MTNAEIIKMLRNCAGVVFGASCIECCYAKQFGCKLSLMSDAANAFESAEKRIAELERGFINRGSIADGLYKLIGELKAKLPKEGEWREHKSADIVNGRLVPNYECSVCHDWNENKTDYCPNCGAKIDGKEQVDVDN